MFQPLSPVPHSTLTITVNDKEFSWVMTLKEKLAVSIKENLWLLSSHEPTSGILGLVNCLRREPEGERIRYNNLKLVWLEYICIP